MASMPHYLGDFSWICNGELDLGSVCIQESIIDVVNMVFLGIFYLLLLVGYVRKHSVIGSSGRRDGVFIVATVCCAITSIAYLSTGFWKLILGTSNCSLQNVVYFVRGMIWISVSVSLLVKRSKWVKILTSIWWVSFFLLVSALNVEILSRTQKIKIGMVTWPLSFLISLCAFRSSPVFSSKNIDELNLSKPLLFKKTGKKNTEVDHASFLRKLTFSWMNPLISMGYLNPLVFDDIPSLATEDEANLAYKKFTLAWDSLVTETSSKRNVVIQTMANVYLKENIYTAVLACLRTLTVVTFPLLLYAFVNYSSSDNQDLNHGFLLLGLLVILKLVESLSARHWYFRARRSGMRMRSALMVAVYNKQLRLSSSGRKRHSAGEILNYIAIDANRVGDCPWWFHSTWNLSLQLFLSIGVLFGVLGIAALPGLVPLLFCGLINLPFAKMLQNSQSHFMIAQDERLRVTSEILNSMKIIKLQSWEEEFRKFIESARAKEFKWLAKAQFIKAYGSVFYWITPTIVSSVIFSGYVLFASDQLNASKIFTVLATLRSMSEPVRMIPEALSVMIQVKVSFDRINTFLVDDELKNDEAVKSVSQECGASVRLHGGTFKWESEASIPTLRNINLELEKGNKIAVCGPIGAGKSSLLYAMLGEIPKISGTVDVFGSFAYVSQTSWIQSGTVRDNILFGKHMEDERYEKAIKACALDKDIDSFDHGDLTEIGQRGLNLSGGQKQRIQLARAVYNDADIYLLDDPFSAVDAHTAATLFNDCVMGILGKKTVILVTHQVHFLSDVDRILVMKGGEISQSGSYNELLVAGTAFEQLVNAHKNSVTVIAPLDSEFQDTDIVRSDESCSSRGNSDVGISDKEGQGGQLTQEEEKETGDVGLKPFLDYIIVSKGLWLILLGLLSQFGFVSLQATATYWLAFASQVPKITGPVLIGVYTAVSLLSAVFVYLKCLTNILLGLKASKLFFLGFTNAVFKAPMLFFESTPVGRILTRASSDFRVVDFDIPISLMVVLTVCMELASIIGIMAYVTWQVLIIAILAMIAIKYVQDLYLATAMELTRINGTTKAPILSFAAETSPGLVTIRTFNMVDRFFENYLKLVDTNNVLSFHSNGAMEWLLLRIETLQNVTFVSSALLLILMPKGYLSPELVGLSLSYAVTLSSTQTFFSRVYCKTFNSIISVERIIQYMKIVPEPPAIVEDHRPPSSWPSMGRIELQNLKIRYRPNSPVVLKGISCTFQEGNRIGVVGRTGSGKSTLISALFRLVEPAGGRILIDGLDICTIGLKDLRMKLSIIPQEPTLFRGSVRTNLDPLGLYSDDEIWTALDKCQLKAAVSTLPNKLDSSVSDEGENWSAGQRQLFCLGRVLLKRNRILVLDEATASIDSATDAILQRVIRNEFANCTVITVAHRVPTVIDSDMVMLLSYGKMVEYDKPSKLMGTNSYFSKLVAEYWSSSTTSYQSFET